MGRDGAIRALVGGFDFDKNKFNHVTQAWRQPGSSFKPFIYSAALEKGFTPATVVNDSPLFYDASVTGSQAWEPKNYDGTFEGPMSLRKGLAKSKNMISIRVLESVGPQNAQNWIAHFGFDPQRHPAYLTMAKDLMEGVIFADAFDPDRAEVKNFLTQFAKENTGGPAGSLEAYGWDGIHLVAEALRRAGAPDREKLRAAMQGVERFDTVVGAKGSFWSLAGGKRA
jgi:cell division protein FtsI/penicillin-binding protein 2